MKKIINFPILLVIFPLFSILANPRLNLRGITSNDILQQISPDSLYPLLKNRPIIYYTYGHYGYSWSLVVRIDSTYRIYSGHVDYSGDQYLDKTSESIPFDTTTLIVNNKALFSWGFDTISTEAVNREKVFRKPFLTIYADLWVFNADGLNIFCSDNAIAFTGSDSIAFNKKFDKLCLIMWWLSNSKIRKHVPESIIY